MLLTPPAATGYSYQCRGRALSRCSPKLAITPGADRQGSSPWALFRCVWGQQPCVRERCSDPVSSAYERLRLFISFLCEGYALLHALRGVQALEADGAQVLDAVGRVGLELRLVALAGSLLSVAGTLLGGLYESRVRWQSRKTCRTAERCISPLHPVVTSISQPGLFQDAASICAGRRDRTLPPPILQKGFVGMGTRSIDREARLGLARGERSASGEAEGWKMKTGGMAEKRRWRNEP